jgi:hypothetical protein
MRFPFVAIAPVFFVAAASLASATPADEKKSDARKSGAAESSTGLTVASAAESAGAKLLLTNANNGNGGGNGNGNAGGNSPVPPGRRCDPNDPRPGCQPIKQSPKK